MPSSKSKPGKQTEAIPADEKVARLLGLFAVKEMEQKTRAGYLPQIRRIRDLRGRHNAPHDRKPRESRLASRTKESRQKEAKK